MTVHTNGRGKVERVNEAVIRDHNRPGHLAVISGKAGDSATQWLLTCFILPWVIGFILFVGGPIVASFIPQFFSLEDDCAPQVLWADALHKHGHHR